ncbi:hypothetical protein DXT99_01775 [Pontibacter diazotrophicus]|uniref:Uncharacterized protein n=1 Tax=Pontibacter diazotrophicus TaxID=1400979 RepID=A0A3D8LHL3_9BACT|nr:hypothetical protein [Pontibacter diazotrophicus]RDV16867.1 hypothetical protein DXT99_01775 [Pontibacter diazotrophicus]
MNAKTIFDAMFVASRIVPAKAFFQMSKKAGVLCKELLHLTAGFLIETYLDGNRIKVNPLFAIIAVVIGSALIIAEPCRLSNHSRQAAFPLGGSFP